MRRRPGQEPRWWHDWENVALVLVIILATWLGAWIATSLWPELFRQ